jgi:hypothetical protein
VQGNGRCQIRATALSRHLARRTEENRKNPQSAQPVFRPRFETCSPRKHARSFAVWANSLGEVSSNRMVMTSRNGRKLSGRTRPVRRNLELPSQVILYTCIREMLDSNLGRDNGYADWGCLRFSSVLPGKFLNSTSIRPRQLPSKSFPIHYSPILLFDAEILTGSWNESTNEWRKKERNSR